MPRVSETAWATWTRRVCSNCNAATHWIKTGRVFPPTLKRIIAVSPAKGVVWGSLAQLVEQLGLLIRWSVFRITQGPPNFFSLILQRILRIYSGGLLSSSW